jgi:hypothetical protein
VRLDCAARRCGRHQGGAHGLIDRRHLAFTALAGLAGAESAA